VFPEGYPNVDPRYTPKIFDGQMLPFRPGAIDVPVVPAGLSYEPGLRWTTILRFGAPLPAHSPAAQLVGIAERRVAALSAPRAAYPVPSTWARAESMSAIRNR
jgi:hypothetical protein